MDKQKRYEDTEKGKAARARAQATRQAKRKELAKVRLAHESRRRILSSAKFSKQYTVHTTVGAKQTEKVGDRLLFSGVSAFKFERVYGETESETPQCVQGGVPRWSESILNPTYVKKLNEDETLILRLRKVLARIHKLLERKSQGKKRKNSNQEKL
jgi:hypothetical protein